MIWHDLRSTWCVVLSSHLPSPFPPLFLSTGLPKASYLQRRTPGHGSTPVQSERTPGDSTPYNSHANSSRMSMSISMAASPTPGLTTPGRRSGRRGSGLSHYQQQQQDYSRMDETFNGGGMQDNIACCFLVFYVEIINNCLLCVTLGDVFNKDDSVDQDDYNDPQFSGSSHNQMTTRYAQIGHIAVTVDCNCISFNSWTNM
jgi:hypothetical protein